MFLQRRENLLGKIPTPRRPFNLENRNLKQLAKQTEDCYSNTYNDWYCPCAEWTWRNFTPKNLRLICMIYDFTDPHRSARFYVPFPLLGIFQNFPKMCSKYLQDFRKLLLAIICPARNKAEKENKSEMVRMFNFRNSLHKFP